MAGEAHTPSPTSMTRSRRNHLVAVLQRTFSLLDRWRLQPRALPAVQEALYSAPRRRQRPTLQRGITQSWPAAREALSTAPHGWPDYVRHLPRTRRTIGNAEGETPAARIVSRDTCLARAGRTRGADDSASWPAQPGAPTPVHAAYMIANAEVAPRAAAVLHRRPHARR